MHGKEPGVKHAIAVFFFRKVFCLGGAHFPSARKALIKRGWIEVSIKSRSAMASGVTGVSKLVKLLPYRTGAGTAGNAGGIGPGNLAVLFIFLSKPVLRNSKSLI